MIESKKRKQKKLTTHKQLLDKAIGKRGSRERDLFEFELQIELLGRKIKEIRQEKMMTQEELGKKIGVEKAQISKLERGSVNLTIKTIKKVFEALNTKLLVRTEPVTDRVSYR